MSGNGRIARCGIEVREAPLECSEVRALQGVVVRFTFSSACIRLERIATCWRSATKVNISNQRLNFAHACVGNLQSYLKLPEHRTHFHMKIEMTSWRTIEFHLQIIGWRFFRLSHGIHCCAKNCSSSLFKNLTIQVWQHLGRLLRFLMLCEEAYICMVQRACITCLFVAPCPPHNRNTVLGSLAPNRPQTLDG